MHSNNIKVIGIDSALSKDSTVFADFDIKIKDDQEIKAFTPYNLDHVKLAKCLKELKKNTKQKVLICWDAPLTGYSLIAETPLWIRPVEQFFQKKYFPIQKKPKSKLGVSVLAYAGCPHWTITRHCLGLPVVGQYDSKNIPFKLITSESQKKDINKSVVEVHPAVAMFYWSDRPCKLEKYKKNNKAVKRIWDKLKEKLPFRNIPIDPENDDQLDAIVAFVLGKEWLKSRSTVNLLGNEQTGAILLPKNESLFKEFDEFNGNLL